jgi:hypothetical protein
MIIQRPDGSYELSCPLPPLFVLWLRGLARRGRALATAAREQAARLGEVGAPRPQCEGSGCQ